MLEVKLGTEGQNYVSVNGKLEDIVRDLLLTVSSIHQAFAERDAETAEVFQNAIQEMIADPELWELSVAGITIGAAEGDTDGGE